MNYWRELVSENPMMIDVHRFGRRFFSVGGKAGTSGVKILGAFAYLLILLLLWSFRDAMSAQAVIQLQTFLFCFIVPGTLHGAVAAEREKRTWDLLVVAPITRAQIIVGKLVTGLTVIGITAALCAVPMLFSRDIDENVGSVLRGEGISLFFALALAGVTLLTSAYQRRAFPAQLSVYTLLFVVLVVFPMFAYSSANGKAVDEWMFLHPFIAIGKTMDVRLWLSGYGWDGQRNTGEQLVIPMIWQAWPQLLVYLGLGAACVSGAPGLSKAVDRREGG